MRWLSIVWVVSLFACDGVTDEHLGEDTDTDTDTVVDTDTEDTDTTTDTETSEPSAQGLMGKTGEAMIVGTALWTDDFDPILIEVVDGTYDGWEEWYVTDLESDEDVCRIRYDMDSTAEREDCGLWSLDKNGKPAPPSDNFKCAFGYDIVFANASVEAGTDEDCMAVLGYDSTNVSELNGLTASYGYLSDYIGHAQVMMAEQEAKEEVLGSVNGLAWFVVTFASFDKDTQVFGYDWEDSVIDLPGDVK